MTSNRDNQNRHQRRGVFRTVLTLVVVVMAIYLAFIGRAAFNYYGA